MSERTIYVAGFCPSSTHKRSDVGGFEWRRTSAEILPVFREMLANDPELRSDYVLRALELPLNVKIDDKDAVDEWLDTIGFDLWNTVEQDDNRCKGCGEPFTRKDTDGGRCLTCGRSIS